MMQTLEAIHAELKALRDGGLVAPGLDEALAQHEAKHRALVADNAELARAGHWLEHERDAYHPMNCRCGVCERARDVFKQPHPGAALLSEMEALRKRVDDAEDAKRDAMSDSDSLRRRFSDETARAENAERERDEARAQAAVARDATLEEVAIRVGEADIEWSGDGVRALKSKPESRFVDAEEVKKVLRLFRDHKTLGDRWTCNEVANRLGINLDGEP